MHTFSPNFTNEKQVACYTKNISDNDMKSESITANFTAVAVLMFALATAKLDSLQRDFSRSSAYCKTCTLKAAVYLILFTIVNITFCENRLHANAQHGTLILSFHNCS